MIRHLISLSLKNINSLKVQVTTYFFYLIFLPSLFNLLRVFNYNYIYEQFFWVANGLKMNFRLINQTLQYFKFLERTLARIGFKESSNNKWSFSVDININKQSFLISI